MKYIEKETVENYKYALLGNPGRFFLGEILQFPFIPFNEETNNLIDLEGIEVSSRTQERDALVPFSTVAGLTLEDLSDYPFFPERSEFKNYLFFAMYDSVVINNSKHVYLRYLLAINKETFKDERIEDVVRDHLEKVYPKLSRSNQNRAANFMENEYHITSEYHDATRIVDKRYTKTITTEVVYGGK